MPEQYKFVEHREGQPSDGWNPEVPPQTVGTLVSVKPEVVAVVNGTLRQGVSKSGKSWQRWNNTSATFYSIRSGKLRIYERATTQVHGRYTRNRGDFRDVTWAPQELTVMAPNAKETVRIQVSRLLGRKLNTLGRRDIWVTIAPTLRHNDKWVPTYGLGPALRRDDLRGMIETSLGSSRYRKDVAKAIAAAPNLRGLSVAKTLKSLVPVDWLIPVMDTAFEFMGREEAVSMREFFRRLPDSRKRFLLADLPPTQAGDYFDNYYFLVHDTIRQAHNIPLHHALPAANTWGAMHDALVPQVRRFEAAREDREVPQVGVTKKLDGVKAGTLELVSAKKTSELVEWGSEMSHCIGSYGNEAVTGRSHLFGVYDSGKLVANLELDPRGQVRQFYGRFNQTPPRSVVEPVQAAIQKQLKKKVGEEAA